MQKYEFYPEIDLGKYMEDPEQREKGCNYSLLSILVHMGTRTNSGHYIAYIKPGKKQWYKFNDEIISKVSEKYVFDMSFGNEVQRVTLDNYFRPKNSTTFMSSQAYMLVYIKTSCLKENMETIEPMVLVDDFIREKVDKVNLERKRAEFWSNHTLFYIVLPELLVGTELKGCLVDHVGKFDYEKSLRLMKSPELRLALKFKQSLTIREWLVELGSKLGLNPERLCIYRYDNNKGLLNPVLTKKIMKDADVRKLSALFRPANDIPFSCVLYIHVLDHQTPLLKRTERHLITENIMPHCPEENFVNVYEPVQQEMLEEKDGYKDQQEKLLSAEHYLLLVKSFSTTVQFQESKLISKKSKFEDVQKLFPDRKVYFEYFYKPNSLEVHSLDTLNEDHEFLADYFDKSGVVSIILADEKSAPALEETYFELQFMAYVRLALEAGNREIVAKLIDSRMSAMDFFKLARDLLLPEISNLKKIYLKAFEANATTKIYFFNPAAISSLSLEDLVRFLLPQIHTSSNIIVGRLPCSYEELMTKFEVKYLVFDQTQEFVPKESVMLPKDITQTDFLKYFDKLLSKEKEEIEKSLNESKCKDLQIGYPKIISGIFAVFSANLMRT